MYGDNELYCQHREWVAKSAEQHSSLASAWAASVMSHPKSKGDICPSPRVFHAFSRSILFFPWLSLFEGLFPHVLWGGFSRARTCAPSLRFPLFCFHNLHTCPVSNSKNRVAVITWNQCRKSRDCVPFQGGIRCFVKICPKGACYDLIQRRLRGNLWRLWKQKGINCSGARARARARREDCNTF